jgi:hypothetical protein
VYDSYAWTVLRKGVNMKAEKPFLLVALGIAALGTALFAWLAMWWGLSITVKPQDVLNILAPLLLTAGFIERAAEVIITPWRDPGATELKADLAAATTPEQERNFADALDAYVGKTTQYAFATTTAFGLVAAMVGVRALWPFLDTQALAIFQQATLGQKNTFIVFDVVLSAALISGGADGIHSVVSAFTSFFDRTTQIPQKPGNQ